MNDWTCTCGKRNLSVDESCQRCRGRRYQCEVADEQSSPNTPSPDVSESVGQVPGIEIVTWWNPDGGRAKDYKTQENPDQFLEKLVGHTVSHIRRMGLGFEVKLWHGSEWLPNSTWYTLLTIQPQGHAPTQLPAQKLEELISEYKGNLHAATHAERRLFETFIADLESLSPAAPSTTVEGQSLSVPPATVGAPAAGLIEEIKALPPRWTKSGALTSHGCACELQALLDKYPVPPATEGTAEAAKRLAEDVRDYASRLAGEGVLTPPNLKLAWIANEIEKLAEGSAAAVPVEELEALVAVLNGEHMPYAASIVNNLVQKAKAGEQ